MRAFRLTVLSLIVATSLAAQAPAPSSTEAAPAVVLAPHRSAVFDVAALVSGRQRLGLEPLALGRWTIGLNGMHSSTIPPPQVALLSGSGTGGPVFPPSNCPVEGCQVAPGPATTYNVWNLDLAVRYYPAALSFNDGVSRWLVYLGLFAGYQWSTIDNVSYVQPLCLPPGCEPVAVTGRQHFAGWQPGAEAGLRLKLLAPFFIDVGGWFKLVTVNDPMQRIGPGHLDSRLVVAAGIGW